MKLARFTLVISVSILFGCASKPNEDSINYNRKNDIETVGRKQLGNSRNQEVASDGSLLSYSEISDNNYALKVQSNYFHKELDTTDVLLKNVVIKQEIVFFMDSIVKRINYPVKTLNLKTSDGEKINVQENNIYEIAIVSGDNGKFYKISGSGIFSSQSEFYGAYSLQGEVIWYSYATYRNSKGKFKNDPNEVFGDLDDVLKKYKVSEESFNKPKNVVEVKID